MKEAKPGAGLPTTEHLFIKFILLPIVKRALNKDRALALFQKEQNRIKNLVVSCSQELLTKRIKIDRVFGIESHSCDYSVNMVLEHLINATQGSMMIIQALSNNKEVKREVTIEAVKPTKNSEDVLNDFLAFGQSYIDFISKLPNTKSKIRKKHPWFGELNNLEWIYFMSIHTMVHRRQLEKIIQKLQ